MIFIFMDLIYFDIYLNFYPMYFKNYYNQVNEELSYILVQDLISYGFKEYLNNFNFKFI